MAKWHVGDRVQRREDVYDLHSKLMLGTVIRRYGNGWHREIYEVEWDGGKREHGYLPHGLDPAIERRTADGEGLPRSVQAR